MARENHTEPSYSDRERGRVIEDIASWKVEEVEVGGGDAFSPQALDRYVSTLRDLSDGELREFWVGTVGEWVASRRDVPERPTERSFQKVLDGDRDWGYITPVQLSPAPPLD